MGVFLRLGCISFGGPIAHLGYFREEFINRRRWLNDEAYAELVALCQLLPGPTSSQVVFALGMQRAGILGALLASLCFTLPSAILMILFAYHISAMGNVQNPGWLHGLKLAAVAVVAQAVWGMGRQLCRGWFLLATAFLATAVLLVIPGTYSQIGVIAAGALAGYFFLKIPNPSPAAKLGGTQHHVWAIGALVLCLSLLLILPISAAATGNFLIRQFDGFYRAGCLVFGGGHVVLPLLRAEVVPPGWISDSNFLAGYGVAQALPGPLFTFAAYLGTLLNSGPSAWLGGLWCLFAIFLPAWLLVGGCLPFWTILRSKSWAQAAFSGANAAVVGILLAALYHPIAKETILNAWDALIALGAFLLLEVWKVPPWLIVLLCAFAGEYLLAPATAFSQY